MINDNQMQLTAAGMQISSLRLKLIIFKYIDNAECRIDNRVIYWYPIAAYPTQ